MATQVEESPLEAKEDRLRRKAKIKSAKADRLEARGKTKRAAKKRGAAGVKTAKADKIAGKQDAKDKKQAGKQAKKLAKVKGKVDKKAEKKEKRGKKFKKAKADVTAAGKKVAGAVKDKAKSTADKAKGAAKKVKGAAKKVKAGVQKVKRKAAAAAGAFQGTSMEGDKKSMKKDRREARKATRGHKDDNDAGMGGGATGLILPKGPHMGVHDDDTDSRGHAMDQMKGGNWDGSAMHGPSKYDNAHMLKNPGHHQAPSMSGQAYDKKKMFSTKGKEKLHYLENWMHDKKGGSPISKHFGRNKSKKR